MKKRVLHSIFTVAFMAGVSIPSFVQAEGFYLGGSAGLTYANICDDLENSSFVNSCDDSDTGWKLFAGYQLSKHFGAEAFYADFGEVSGTGTILFPQSNQVAPVTAKGNADAFGVAAIARLPIGDKFGIFGKLGVFRWDGEGSAMLGTLPVAQSNHGTDFLFGLGGDYSFNEYFALRVEWERYNGLGDSDVPEIMADSNLSVNPNMDFFSVGVTFSF